MQVIPLAAVANQSFTINLDGDLWNITIKEVNGVMAATFIKNNIALLSSIRITPAYPLIPYPYLSLSNFIFLTTNNDYPYFTEFGITQQLIYSSADEVDQILALIG